MEEMFIIFSIVEIGIILVLLAIVSFYSEIKGFRKGYENCRKNFLIMNEAFIATPDDIKRRAKEKFGIEVDNYESNNF